MDFENSDIEKKYRNKRIYDYSLKQFRLDQYSKEIKATQIKTEPLDRILIGILNSQYKKKVFAYHDKLIKPVVLAKSRTIIDSANIQKEFLEYVESFSSSQLNVFRGYDNEFLSAAFTYFDSLGLSLSMFSSSSILARISKASKIASFFVAAAFFNLSAEISSSESTISSLATLINSSTALCPARIIFFFVSFVFMLNYNII